MKSNSFSLLKRENEGNLPVIRLDVISGRISILSIRMSRSPGNERIMIVSVDGFDMRTRKPSRNPKNTPAMVNVSKRLF